MFKKVAIFFCILTCHSLVQANTASFTFSTECEGNATQLTSTSTPSTGNIILHEWDFDGDSIFDASGATVSHTFPSSGTFDVLLKITTDSGFVAFTSNPITVNPNPTVTYASNGSCLGEVTTFTGSASISNGTIASYNWEFNGNGDFADGSGANQSFTFIAPGYFNVGLRATSGDGCSTESYQTVTIAPKPTVNFTSANVCDGNTVEFVNNSVGLGPAISYSWSFGDGNQSSMKEPSHLYAGPGNFSVKLVGQNTAGCVDSISRMVEVYANPTAAFSVSDVCFEESVEIENMATYNGATPRDNFWDFGNGMTLFDLKNQHTITYGTADTFAITLSVSTTDNCVDTLTKSVIVHPLPVESITPSGLTEFCEGGSVDLSVDPDSGIGLAWSSGQNTATISVTTSGLYEVLLFSPFGCQYKTDQEVIVRQPSPLTISNDTSINNGDEIMLSVSGALNYIWSNLEDPSQSTMDMVEISPEDETTYEVLATNEFGCESTAEVTVSVIDNFNLIPTNLITPDGNGKNDTWFIENIDRYPTCEVLIYDAYGKLVISQPNYQNDFDGTLSTGDRLPEGTYYYVITCEGMDGNLSGPLTLLRLNE